MPLNVAGYCLCPLSGVRSATAAASHLNPCGGSAPRPAASASAARDPDPPRRAAPRPQVVMTDPVTARNGETFQREAFERLRRGKRRPGSKEAQILEALGADVTVVFNWFAKKTVEAVRAAPPRRTESFRPVFLRSGAQPEEG